MFGLFKKKRKKRRQIYSYFDGVKNRYADPMHLWRGMFQDGHEDFVANSKLMHSKAADAKARNEAQDFVVNRVATVFKLHRLNETTGKGLTINEIIDVFAEFLAYAERIKKKLDRIQKQSRHLDLSGLDQNSTTKQDSGSSSTDSESIKSDQSLSPEA